jgi:hypothetical protein
MMKIINKKIIKLFSNDIISFPKTGTRFLQEKLTFTKDLTFDDLFTDKDYRDKPLHIIIRSPKDSLIGAINVNLENALKERVGNLKEIMERILVDEDSHFNTNRFEMLYTYSKLNLNVRFVELKNLNSFLENFVKIPPSKLSIDKKHKTKIFVTEEDIITQEPYLWGLFLRILEKETQKYDILINSKNIYVVPPKFI